MTNIAKMIATVFAATDVEYLKSCLAQRNPGPKAAGSVFAEEQQLESLENADWVEYNHPEVQAPARAYKAPVAGVVGVFPLTDIENQQTLVTLDDRKGTGFLEVVVPWTTGPKTDHTTLLIGPSREDAEKTVVWTFFPGDPIMPSRLEPTEELKHGVQITAEQARELGFVYAKVESPEG